MWFRNRGRLFPVVAFPDVADPPPSPGPDTDALSAWTWV